MCAVAAVLGAELSAVRNITADGLGGSHRGWRRIGLAVDCRHILKVPYGNCRGADRQAHQAQHLGYTLPGADSSHKPRLTGLSTACTPLILPGRPTRSGAKERQHAGAAAVAAVAAAVAPLLLLPSLLLSPLTLLLLPSPRPPV